MADDGTARRGGRRRTGSSATTASSSAGGRTGCAGRWGTAVWRSSKKRKAGPSSDGGRELVDPALRAADDTMRTNRRRNCTRGPIDTVNRYRAAQAALDGDEPIDLVRVRRVVDEARYSMDRSAIIEGREPPLPPEHLRRLGDHGEPAVTIGEDRQPAYVGYPAGYCDGAGTAGWAVAGCSAGCCSDHCSPVGSADGATAGRRSSTTVGATAGGGGFGGGDFGGGDFGGGDFGGGDFG